MNEINRNRQRSLQSPRAWENCLLCGKLRPTGHVVVYGDAPREGVVCSNHTLAELILDPSDRFYVSITMDNPGGAEGRRSRYTSSSLGGDKEVPAKTG